MEDVFDPVSQAITKSIGWQEPILAAEIDEDGAAVPYADLASLTEIRAALRRRTDRGEAEAAVIEATLTDGTIVITDADEGEFEIRLPADDLAAAPPGVWDMRIDFTRDDGVVEPAYVGLREIREGW